MNTRSDQRERLVARWRWMVPAGLLLLAGVVSAEPVKPDQVRCAVRTWVRHVTADARPDATIDRMDPFGDRGQPAAYVVHLSGGGYCIAGADDRLLPVYWYRPMGTFDDANPDYQWVLTSIARRLTKLETAAKDNDPQWAQYRPLLDARAAQWRELVAGRPPRAVLAGRGTEPAKMSLRVTSYWRQGSPYNDFCPELIPGTDERAVVGCVGTTAAQIMYYWRWPTSGNGSKSVTYDRRYQSNWDYEPLDANPILDLPAFFDTRLDWVSTQGGQLMARGIWDRSCYNKARRGCNNGEDCADAVYWGALEALWNRFTPDPETCTANFSTATYNYDLMADQHSDPPGSDDLEAAELSYHAAIAVGMSFGVFASSAGMIRDGMVSRFDYDSGAVSIERSVSSMMEEIRWMRPVELTGRSETGGGHSWVVCGYNTQVSPTQFLMNIGWGGGSTEWATVDEIYPVGQWNTIQVAPAGVVRFVGGVSGGDGRPATPYQDLSTALETAPENTTLIMRAGSAHTVPSDGVRAVLDRPMRLAGHKVRIEAN